MSRTRFRFVSLLLAFVLASTFAVKAQAQDAKRFVVSAGAGGSLDRIARSLAIQADLKSAWAAYIVIDNQVGAAGLKAVEYMRKLPADGSALLVVSVLEAGTLTADYAPTIAGLADFVQIAYLGSVAGPNGKFWYGVFGPLGMPGESARRLEGAIQQAMRSAELSAVLAITLNYQQDRTVSAAALTQALRASALAAGAGGATTGAGAAQQQSNANAAKPVAGQGISLQQLAGGAGRWPAGVEPGNLYIVNYRQYTNTASDAFMLISARSRSEAEQQYERAYNEFRDRNLAPLYKYTTLPGTNGVNGRADLARQSSWYKLDYRDRKSVV